MPNNLSVAVSADVTDLQVKFAVAKAETNALTSEMSKLAKQSAAGIIDPAGQARLQEVAGDMIKAKAEAAALSAELKEMTSATQGVGSVMEDLRNKMSSAFELTGVTVAIEGIMKLGEVIERLGERATTIRTSADVLNVTGEEFQAMRIAAEEAGVSMESVTRVAEKMNVALFEARDGSSAAIEKLLRLGVTTTQINDPMFKTNDLLGVMHDRLTDASTKQEQMSEITKEFGNRAVLVSEALLKYDGSAAAVAEVMRSINGLTDEQTKKLQEAKAWWGELGNTVADTSSKLFVAATNLLPHTTGSTNPALLEMETESREAQHNAQERAGLDRRLLEQEMQNAKAGIAAFKEGTKERVDQMQIYATLAAKYYGSDTVDAVVKANNEIIGAQRSLNEQLLAATKQRRAGEQELDDFIKSSYDAVKVDREQLGLQTAKIAANQTKEEKKQADELYGGWETIYTDIINRHAALLKQMNADTAKSAKEELKSWHGVVGEIEGSETSMISNILGKRKSLSQSLVEMSGQLVIKELADDAKAVTTRLLLRSTAATQEKALEQGGLLYHLFVSNTQTVDSIRKQAQQTSAVVGSQSAQTSAVMAGNAARLASTNAAAASSAATSAAVGSKTVMQDAAKAFSGVYASVAQIPYVGWILAPIAASAAFAGVAAYEGLASLDTGTNYVPQDMVAQLHEGERVTPKAFNPDANPGMSTGTSYSEEHNYNGALHINAFDAQSMARALSRPGGRTAIVNAAVKAYRRGAQ